MKKRNGKMIIQNKTNLQMVVEDMILMVAMYVVVIIQMLLVDTSQLTL
jgi:hypothetical protein